MIARRSHRTRTSSRPARRHHLNPCRKPNVIPHKAMAARPGRRAVTDSRSSFGALVVDAKRAQAGFGASWSVG
jgi:hypothetical protein